MADVADMANDVAQAALDRNIRAASAATIARAWSWAAALPVVNLRRDMPVIDQSEQQAVPVAQIDWRLIAKAAGEHGVRYRTNTALLAFLAAIEPALPCKSGEGAGEAIARSASLALMYLQTGFVECPGCGAEVPTKDLDAAVELAEVVKPAGDTDALADAFADAGKPIDATQTREAEWQDAIEAEREACAQIAGRKAMAIATKLGRGPTLDAVTRGIIEILKDTAGDIRARAALNARGGA